VIATIYMIVYSRAMYISAFCALNSLIRKKEKEHQANNDQYNEDYQNRQQPAIRF
jgi:hypothetical protein